MYDFDYENYYEPSEVDQLVDEFTQRCREFIVPNIKQETDRLKEENMLLKSKNEEYIKRENEIRNKERDLEYKKDNLKREVEREFYKSNIENTLEDMLDKSVLWFADNRSFKQEKCSLCNDNRELVAEFENGQSAKTLCKCNKYIYKYIPEICEIQSIRFYKKDSNYQSERKFYFTSSYSPSTKSDYNYDYDDFNLYNIVDKFTESTKELHKDKRYATVIGFKTQEECQKYCDWLNELRNVSGITIPKKRE